MNGYSTQQYFQENGYVILSGAISKDKGDFLTNHMFGLMEKQKLVKDDQCPLSDAVYGDVEMEKLLKDMAGPIGNNIGRRLLPTYAYARIYRPGEVLKKHKDRPSCEISATMTLGYDGKNIWPIFFENREGTPIPAQLDVGEMAVYQGCELLHWRDAFKGNWHVQVFLHYVDADGPYADWANDRRDTHHVDYNNQQPVDNKPQDNDNEGKQPIIIRNPFYNSLVIPSMDDTFPGFFSINSEYMPELMFTEEECDKIIALTNDFYSSSATVGGSDRGKLSPEIRSADIYVLENDDQNRWIFEKIANAVAVANQLHFDYEIAGIVHGLQLIHYTSDGDIKGHYDWHIDAGKGHVSTRKISLTVQLTDPNLYEGGELVVNDHGGIVSAPNEKGAINMFPSYMPHQVTDVTKGERFALVIWIHGSRRFR